MHYQYKFVIICIGLNFEALILSKKRKLRSTNKIVCVGLVQCSCLLSYNFVFICVDVVLVLN